MSKEEFDEALREAGRFVEEMAEDIRAHSLMRQLAEDIRRCSNASTDIIICPLLAEE